MIGNKVSLERPAISARRCWRRSRTENQSTYGRAVSSCISSSSAIRRSGTRINIGSTRRSRPDRTTYVSYNLSTFSRYVGALFRNLMRDILKKRREYAEGSSIDYAKLTDVKSYMNFSCNSFYVNCVKLDSKNCEILLLFSRLFCSVSESRMGHRHAGSQESYQSNADGESRKEDHCQRGIEASMDLRKFALSAIAAVGGFTYVTYVRIFGIWKEKYNYSFDVYDWLVFNPPRCRDLSLQMSTTLTCNARVTRCPVKYDVYHMSVI